MVDNDTDNAVQRVPNPRGEGGRLREDLLEAALGIIDAQGPGALTLRAVARGAGVAAPSVYRHFTNLEALATAVSARCFDDLVQQIRTAQDLHRDVGDRLLGGCEGYLRYAERYPGRYAVLFGRGAGPATATFVDQRAFDLLVTAVADYQNAGGHTTPDTRDIATAIWAGLDGYANLRVHRPHFPWPANNTMLRHLVLDHVKAPGRAHKN